MAKQANSSAGSKKIVDEIITSLNKDQEYMSLKRGAKSNPREFNKKLLSFLEKIKSKYDGDAKMLGADLVGDAEKTRLEEEILSDLEPVFHDKLVGLRNEIVSSAKLEIRAALERYREPHDAVDDVVAPYMDKFNKECPKISDAHTNFVNLLRDERKKLRSQIKKIAQREAVNIGKMQANNTNNMEPNSSNTQANNKDNMEANSSNTEANNKDNIEANSSNTQANNKLKYIDVATKVVSAGVRIMAGDVTAAFDVRVAVIDLGVAAFAVGEAAIKAGLDYAKHLSE